MIDVATCGKMFSKALRHRQLLDERVDWVERVSPVVVLSAVVVAPLLAAIVVVKRAMVVVGNTVLVTEERVVEVAPLVTEVVVVVGPIVVVVVALCTAGTVPITCHPNFPGPKVLSKFTVEPGTLEETEKRFQYIKVPLPPPLATVSASFPARFVTPM